MEHSVLPTKSADSRAKQEALWRSCLARCAAGDQTGLADLYDGSNEFVYSSAVRMLGGVADAEEVTPGRFYAGLEDSRSV